MARSAGDEKTTTPSTRTHGPGSTNRSTASVTLSESQARKLAGTGEAVFLSEVVVLRGVGVALTGTAFTCRRREEIRSWMEGQDEAIYDDPGTDKAP